MRRKPAPIVFDDDQKELAEASRDSMVAPAEVSPSATAKATTKRTADGQPVHSFGALLEWLFMFANSMESQGNKLSNHVWGLGSIV